MKIILLKVSLSFMLVSLAWFGLFIFKTSNEESDIVRYVTFNEVKKTESESIPFDDPPRAAWLWQSPQGMNDQRVGQIVSISKNEKINTLYLYSDDVLAFSPATNVDKKNKLKAYELSLAKVIQAMHKEGIDVQALGGSPSWSSDKNDKATSFFNFVIEYNKKVSSEARFDGIQFDIEPLNQELNVVMKDRILKEYLSVANSLVEKYKSANLAEHQLAFGFAVPMSFDGAGDFAATSFRGGERKGAGLHLLDLLAPIDNSYIALMDYRNFAVGKDGSIEHARIFMDYAKQNASRTKVVIGQETLDIKPAKITFFGKSKNDLFSEMEKITEVYGKESVFGGFAIHTLDSYEKMK